MAIELNDLMRDVLNSEAYGFVGAINSSNQPVVTRFFGFIHDDPMTTLTAYTFKKDAKHVLEHLSDGSKMAITLSNTMNYNTCQFKGTYQRHYNTTEDEMPIIHKNNAKQAKIMEMFGIQREAFASWKYEPSVAIVLNVEEVFDQTPKINTDGKIR